MKKVLKRAIIIFLELVAIVIGANVAAFAMFALGKGIQNFRLSPPETEKETAVERRPSAEETEKTEKGVAVMGQTDTEKQSETQESIIILEETQIQQSESQEQFQTQQTEAQQQTESPIVIIDGGSSWEYEGEEIIEFFTEQGTFFY